VNISHSWYFDKKNYLELVDLYEKYEKKGLQILAFPCGQFNFDKKTNAAIKKEAREKHGVRFPVMDKVHVNGPKTHNVFKYLKGNTSELRDKIDSSKVVDIPWNFCRWVIDMNGKIHMYLNPTESLDRCTELIEYLCGNEDTP